MIRARDIEESGTHFLLWLQGIAQSARENRLIAHFVRDEMIGLTFFSWRILSGADLKHLLGML